MQKFVGVTSLSLYVPTKRDALLFDQIGVPLLDRAMGELDAATAAELEWLVERDIVIPVEFHPDGSEQAKDCATFGTAAVVALDAVKQFSGLADLGFSKFDVILRRDFPRIEGTDEDRCLAIAHDLAVGELEAGARDPGRLNTVHHRLVRAGTQRVLRTISHQLKSREVDAVPMLVDADGGVSAQDPAATVLDVVIDNFPEPDDSTSWEAILDFRADEDARRTVIGLRHWMGKIAKKPLTPTEMQLEIEHLLQQYRDHMNVHGISTRRSTLAKVVTALAKWNLGDAITELAFAIFQRKTSVLQAELTAPGRELAYLAKAQDHFKR